jgi:hypothetical protein
MSYFTSEQRQYLENIGFTRARDNAYWMRFQDCYGTILVEDFNDIYKATIETLDGVDSVVEGDNLKKVVRSALRRYKYKAQSIIKMIEHINELYTKTEGIPK